LIVSVIVLLLQPLAVLRKKQIIRKAIEKRKQFPSLLVVGITGSFGKTSVKEFLATILSQKFNVLKTKEHQNSEMGICQSILDDLKPEHQIFIVEMGAYNKGGIKLLCDIALPKIGILAGINEQHLATFGSQKNIIETKFELINALPEDGTAILNYDNQYVRAENQNLKSARRVKNKILYSTTEKLDIWSENILVSKDSTYFQAFLKSGENINFKVNVLGKHNVANVLAAIAAAKELGMTLEEISRAAEKIEVWQGGMVLKKSLFGSNIIDSTYSANPDGVISALEYLKVWPGRKAIIIPCLIELGSASKEVHKRIGEKIAENCELAIITTKDRFKEIKKSAREKGMKPENIIFSDKPKEIKEKVKSFNNENDIILLEGRVSKEIIERLIK
jgi:UDP-N-acetylmuramoyl-tripeptide--D-alanyl-D-alanine ligase